MITFAILLNAVLGGIWRRWLGGWSGPSEWAVGTLFERALWNSEGKHRRSAIVAAGTLLTWPAWIALPWWGAALASGAIMVFFIMGHRFDSWWIVLRYLLVGAIYPVGKRLWPTRYTEVAEVVIGAFFWGAFAALLFI